MTLVRTVDDRSDMLKEVESLDKLAKELRHELHALAEDLASVLRPVRLEDSCGGEKPPAPTTVQEALARLAIDMAIDHDLLASLRCRLQLG